MSTGNRLPSSNVTSKKAQILELSAAGHPNKEIAIKVEASQEYVAKVKSEAKRAAFQGRPLVAPSSARTSAIAVGTKLGIHSSPGSPLGGKFRTSFVSLKETEENVQVRRELWKKFDEKVPNVEIIKETGLNPSVVWSEFEYFLLFKRRDPYALQKDVMDYLSTRTGKEGC